MWNLESFTYQLGDAFEKVRKEVESFGAVEETKETELENEEVVVEVKNTRDRTSNACQEDQEKGPVSLKLTIDEENTQCDLHLVVHEVEADAGETDMLEIREMQLQEQSQKLLHLQERNEELEKSALSISKQEYQTSCQQYEQRLRAAEDRIYALIKERDALAQLSSESRSKEQIIKEKDEMIEEVMVEGERLSKKQMDLENAIRKKTGRIKELEGENEELTSKLMKETSKAEKLSYEKLQLTQNLQQQEESYKQQIEAQDAEFKEKLKENQEAITHVENEAKQLANESLLKRAADAEATVSSLTAYVGQLESDLEAQHKTLEQLEFKFKQELDVLREKSRNAESRHEELLAKFPDATQPLLHQLEALQASLDSNTEDWTHVERSLLDQLDTLTRELQTAQQKEQNINRKYEILMERYQELNDAHHITKKNQSSFVGQLENVKMELEHTRKSNEELEIRISDYKGEAERAKVQQQEVEGRLQSDLSSAQTAKLQMQMDLKQLRADYKKRISDLENSLKQQIELNSHSQSQNSVDEISPVSEISQAAELTTSKNIVTTKEHQLDRMHKQIKSLENTRDHLSSELVFVSQRAIKAESNLADFERMKENLLELQTRYSSAVELLGEKEEKIEEIKADLEDFKQMYRDQIAYVAEQLSSKTL